MKKLILLMLVLILSLNCILTSCAMLPELPEEESSENEENENADTDEESDHTHKKGTPVRENYTEASCSSEEWYYEVVYCTICDKRLSRKKVTVRESLPHSSLPPVVENEIKPTETMGGSYDLVIYCDVCGEAISRQTVNVPPTAEGPHVHEPHDGWDYDGVKHWHSCDSYYCTEPRYDIAVHEFVNNACATCGYVLCNHVDADNNDRCDLCDIPFSDGDHVHSYGEWQYNNDSHWRDCTSCSSQQLVKGEHSFTSYKSNECVTCGYICNHTFSDVYEYDPYGHWQKTTCGHSVMALKYVHFYDHNGLCVCGRHENEPDHYGEHTFEDSWCSLDESYHWKAPTCGCTIEQMDYVAFEIEEHIDNNFDFICDVCSADIIQVYDIESKYENYIWPETEIVICLNEDSNKNELTSQHRRFLAGDSSFINSVDYLIRDRNVTARSVTNVAVRYTYWGNDDDSGWGRTVSRITNLVLANAPNSPDIYINQMYDMVAAHINGTFSNLLSKNYTSGGNYFSFADPEFLENYILTSDDYGYMIEFMSSLSLSSKKQYFVASDYLIDIVRASCVIPVNVALLNVSGAYESYAGDRDADGDSDMIDFYEMVLNGEWTYEVLADYSNLVWKNLSGTVYESIDDVNGFILSTNYGVHASALLYSNPINIFDLTWDESTSDYKCAYPSTNEKLADFATILGTMVGSNGVYVANVKPQEILDKFASNKVLFGGITLLGALEGEAYQEMKSLDGFGIVPVPLYQRFETTDDGSKVQNRYKTAIHNMARIAAIASNTTEFTQCSAYLDYQSTHSSEILHEYYLEYFTMERDALKTVEMLEIIRSNIGSSFDATYESLIGYYLNRSGGTNNSIIRMFMSSNYNCTTIGASYLTITSIRSGYLAEIVAAYERLP